MATRATIELLGVFQVKNEEGVLVSISQAHQRIVLAALALADVRGVSSDNLLSAIWDEAPPRSARKTLHGYIARLRRLLGADSIRTRSGGYVLNLDRYEVDTRLVRTHIEAGRRSTASDERLRLFSHALTLFRGEPLEGVPSTVLQLAHADVLRDLGLLALEHWAREQMRADPAAAIGPLREASSRRPHQESLWALLVEALAASGRRAEALDCYQRARRLLLDDLGIEPGPGLRQAQQDALASSAELLHSRSENPTRLENRMADALVLHRARGAAIAVTGPPGAGKTRAAMAVATEVSPAFGAGRPMTVSAFATLEVDAAPRDTAARALREWGLENTGDPVRDLVDAWARSRSLIVLDDVTHVAQYEWLLPVPPYCGLIICSTVPRPVGPHLDVFELCPYTLSEVIGLLGQVRPASLGVIPDRVAKVLDVVLEGLPAAVHALANRVADEPDLQLYEIAAQLQDPRRRLDALASRSINVRAHFHRSYHQLEHPARRAFRLLGWLDSHSFNDTVAAAALHLPRSEVRGLIAELVRAGLVHADTRDSGRRYRISQLGRSLAREISDYTDDHSLRDAAVRRALRAWHSNTLNAGPSAALYPWGESSGTRPLMRP
ncbi:BTAD domain-containing putative transcriptional regulator [Streptomyces sp. NPDC059340]|uniref:AfsR/SARP family transcriptional regulator n=1 Tax=Streptomyces sp. NPDC059340 TaxID=3346806 RepID=UPI003682DD39